MLRSCLLSGFGAAFLDGERIFADHTGRNGHCAHTEKLLMPDPFSLVLAFDHPVVCAGLTAMLADTPYRIVAQVSSGTKVVETCRSTAAEVLMIDVCLPSRDTFRVLQDLVETASPTRAILLAPTADPLWMARAVAWSAHDFLLRSLTREDLLESLNRARDGASPAADSRLARLRAAMSDRPKSGKNVPLTKREIQTARLLGLGLSNREIARVIDVRIETVKEHVQNLLRKLDAADRTQVAVMANQNGWVPTAN